MRGIPPNDGIKSIRDVVAPMERRQDIKRIVGSHGRSILSNKNT
ncbi:MAG: hypothetical protein OES25_13320 [Acidobacteriota bacterium]|nr:hypothetical protein [Acidobacteriota bacterium]